jgi:hypothetical protein
MKLIVSFLGIKGGSGKSTSSQTFAYGVAQLGHSSFIMSTDLRRRENKEIKDNRHYIQLDGRNQDDLVKHFNDFMTFDEGNELAVLAIEGGANESRELDTTLATLGDIIAKNRGQSTLTKQMVIIPFMRSPDDLDSAHIELTTHEKSFGLPNRWPTNPMALRKANRDRDDKLIAFKDRILQPNYDCNATVDLLGDLDTLTANSLNRAARALTVQILGKAGINAFSREHIAA